MAEKINWLRHRFATSAFVVGGTRLSDRKIIRRATPHWRRIASRISSGNSVPGEEEFDAFLSRTKSAAKSVRCALRPAMFDRDSGTLDPTEFAQPLLKSGGPFDLVRRRGHVKETDGRQPRFGLHSERPCKRRSAERDELQYRSL